MPTYSYRCKNCEHAFDIHQSFTDDALTACPECGEERLRKVFGSVGVSFKGSGFYATDSRTGSSAGTSGSSDSSSSSESASGSSSESASGSSSSDSSSSTAAGSSGSGSGSAGAKTASTSAPAAG